MGPSAAWAGYQAQVEGFEPRVFRPRLFASYLRSEWRKAKGRAALEAQVAAEPVMTPRAAEIRNELQVMEMSDAPTNWTRHHDLTVELFRIAAMEAPAIHA